MSKRILTSSAASVLWTYLTYVLESFFDKKHAEILKTLVLFHGVAIPHTRVFSEFQRPFYQRMTLDRKPLRFALL